MEGYTAVLLPHVPGARAEFGVDLQYPRCLPAPTAVRDHPKEPHFNPKHISEANTVEKSAIITLHRTVNLNWLVGLGGREEVNVFPFSRADFVVFFLMDWAASTSLRSKKCPRIDGYRALRTV